MNGDLDDQIKAYEDISAMIGASLAVRSEDMPAEQMHKMMMSIVKEWNERGMLPYFLTCLFNRMGHFYTRMARCEGLMPEELLKSDYVKIFGEP